MLMMLIGGKCKAIRAKTGFVDLNWVWFSQIYIIVV
jgi:hypothetical protein